MIFSNLYGEFYIGRIPHQVLKVFSFNEWIPVKVHSEGQKIASIIREGKVLTLAPIYPLEGRIAIYEEFTTGPFAWRVGSLIVKKGRAKNRVICKDDLFVFLKKEPPKGILVGFEGGLEDPMINYATQNGYKKIGLSKGKVLWILPEQ